MDTLNEVFSTLSVPRRYEVWFLRMGLADGSGAWWFRYLVMNPGRAGCAANPAGSPVQVWATWFPRDDKPQSFIQGFDLEGFNLSKKSESPFHFSVGKNSAEENSCRGSLNVDGHAISWTLRYHSNFRVTLSNKGWIGFSRTPHSDAVFSGEVTMDGKKFTGDPVGFGVQGHNCGYRHRNFWRWAHGYFPRADRPASTLEALVYEMPFGLVFRKAILWHDGQRHVFRNIREDSDRSGMQWNLQAKGNGMAIDAAIDGRGPSLHRLAYLKTNCSGTFEVSNNSLASASLLIEKKNGYAERLECDGGAVLEMVG